MEEESNQADKEALANVVGDNLNEKGSRISTNMWKDQEILYRLQPEEFLSNTTS